MSPSALGRSGWPGCVADQNCWFWSINLFSCSSDSMEESTSRNKDDIVDTQAVLRPAENWNIFTLLLHIARHIPNEALPVIDKVHRHQIEATAAGRWPVSAIIEVTQLSPLVTCQLFASINLILLSNVRRLQWCTYAINHNFWHVSNKYIHITYHHRWRLHRISGEKYHFPWYYFASIRMLSGSRRSWLSIHNIFVH